MRNMFQWDLGNQYKLIINKPSVRFVHQALHSH